MVQEITKKIMNGGLKKYSEIHNEELKNIQIRATKGEGENVKYEICKNWQPIEEITFRDILNKKIDILSYEAIATPFLYKSLDLYSKMFSVELEKISVFIFNTNNEIYVAVFDSYKSLKVLTMKKHFELLGM